jgi:hypothetical protein
MELDPRADRRLLGGRARAPSRSRGGQESASQIPPAAVSLGAISAPGQEQGRLTDEELPLASEDSGSRAWFDWAPGARPASSGVGVRLSFPPPPGSSFAAGSSTGAASAASSAGASSAAGSSPACSSADGSSADGSDRLFGWNPPR